MTKEKRQGQVGPKLLLHNPTTEVLLRRGAIAPVPFSLWGCQLIPSYHLQHRSGMKQHFFIFCDGFKGMMR